MFLLLACAGASVSQPPAAEDSALDSETVETGDSSETGDTADSGAVDSSETADSGETADSNDSGADTGAPALRVAFTNGSAVASFSPGGPALAAPWGVAVEAAAAPASAAQSAFWVSDAAGNRVFRFALLPAPARLATAGSGAAR